LWGLHGCEERHFPLKISFAFHWLTPVSYWFWLKKTTIEAMDTNCEINQWAAATLAALLAHCIEQALEAQAFIDLMWGDFE